MRIHSGIEILVDDDVNGWRRSQGIIQRSLGANDGSRVIVANPIAVPKLALMKAGVDTAIPQTANAG